jgi:hypothetical protein
MDKLKLAVQETGITQIAIMEEFRQILEFETPKETEKNTVGKPLFRNLNIRPIMLMIGGVSKVLSQLKLPLLFLKEYKYKLCNYFTIRIFRNYTTFALIKKKANIIKVLLKIPIFYM